MSTYTYPSECIRCGRSLQRDSLYGNQYVECSCTKVDVPTMTTLNQVPTVANMTLRDWFAGQALVACYEHVPENYRSNVAMEAWRMADAMLKAREVKP